MEVQNIDITAELVRADTALQSFRDGGYDFNDAIGEIVDNSIQAGARKLRFDWNFEQVKKGKSDKPKRELVSLAVCDDGQGIPPNILPKVLTIGFSTRYNNREGIGRFGVGFKLATISQAQRLEIYTKPAFLTATAENDQKGTNSLVYEQPNIDGNVYYSYLDLEEIADGRQVKYTYKQVTDFPAEYKKLMENNVSGTMILWRKVDRLNEGKAYAESADEKIRDLNYFLARTYRIYIDRGLEIYLPEKTEHLFPTIGLPLSPYDPTFQIENREATILANKRPMKGELVEEGQIKIEKDIIRWKVFLTPKITRLARHGGGKDGPDAKGQFSKLKIEDNQGKISFLRHEREVGYNKVWHMFPSDAIDKNRNLDRFIAIEVLFPPALDEYFQVKHIKRGIEPVGKLKKMLENLLEKPIISARKRIREVWGETEDELKALQGPEVTNGGRENSELTVKESVTSMPKGRAGETVTVDEENAALRKAATEVGITDPVKQDQYINQAKQKPFVALDTEWAGKGLLDIDHLNQTVIVRINRRHPFIREVYNPLREALDKGVMELESDYLFNLLQKATEGIDLLFFAYAKAENMSQQPEDDYMELREDWGKFSAIFLKKREEMTIS
ncbi:MAG: ATP-binding protein [Mucilaginibacter sp.]